MKRILSTKKQRRPRSWLSVWFSLSLLTGLLVVFSLLNRSRKPAALT